jgi:quinol monooxygenase YgiN
MTAISRFVTFRARPGEGDTLAERLLRAASLVADAPGCELWLMDREHGDPDVMRVSEIWATREQCDALLRCSGLTVSPKTPPA